MEAFSKAVRKYVVFPPETFIRKLTGQELSLFWSMISFDIQEPIFVLESPEHLVVTAFTDGAITWIDDLHGISMKKGQPRRQ